MIKTVALGAASGAGNTIYSIAVGADGNLWFEANLSEIGRVTPSGPLRLFTRVINGTSNATSPKRSSPARGAGLWFTLLDGSLARIDLAGHVTTVVRGLPDEGDNLVSGPDGDLWLTENGNTGLDSGDPQAVGGHVARVTPSGAVSYYSFATRMPRARRARRVARLRHRPARARRVRRPRLVASSGPPRHAARGVRAAPEARDRGGVPPPGRARARAASDHVRLPGAPPNAPVLAHNLQLLAWEQITGDPDNNEFSSSIRVLVCSPPHGRRRRRTVAVAPSTTTSSSPSRTPQGSRTFSPTGRSSRS